MSITHDQSSITFRKREITFLNAMWQQCDLERPVREACMTTCNGYSINSIQIM